MNSIKVGYLLLRGLSDEVMDWISSSWDRREEEADTGAVSCT